MEEIPNNEPAGSTVTPTTPEPSERSIEYLLGEAKTILDICQEGFLSGKGLPPRFMREVQQHLYELVTEKIEFDSCNLLQMLMYLGNGYPRRKDKQRIAKELAEAMLKSALKKLNIEGG